MQNKLCFLHNYILSKLCLKKTTHCQIRNYLKHKGIVAGNRILSSEEINLTIKNAILSGIPFLAGRFGATELFAVRTFDFCVHSKYDKALSQMQMWSGFFPPTEKMGVKFKNLMVESIPEADAMGIWMLPFEEYYLKKYGKKELAITYLLDLEPWSAPKNPWSAALKGKKVLVIHPFNNTIEKQYAKHTLLYPETNILPEFELKTLKAVQTIAGEKDGRFETWFEALEWMYQQAMKIDFDIAIIGCGAYGFPLAAKIKKAGKQAIHMAGATQLLFGIKGRRWEDNSVFAYVQKFFNDAWVYPDEDDRPQNASKVENGCYW